MTQGESTVLRASAIVAIATALAPLSPLCGLPAQEPSSLDSAAQQIERRANDIAAMFSAAPAGYESVFGDAFLAQVPTATLDQIFEGYHRAHGAATKAEIIGPFAGGVTVVRFHFDDGAAAIMQFGLEPTEPYRVAGAAIGPAFELGEGSTGGGRVVKELEYETDAYETRTSLRLPFDGEWFVFWGGRVQSGNYHRASALQRYAYDLVIRRDGSTHAGDGDRNDDYYCEGEPLLAPAAGTVVRAVDGVKENVPGEMNADEALGNHVVIDHGNGEFSLLAHMQMGSVSVRRGEPVPAGHRVGACGNSGNSSEPHLHYQLQDGPDFGTAVSLPAPFVGYEADGVYVESGEPRQGQVIEKAGQEAGAMIDSERWPVVRVRVAPEFRHLGSREVSLGGSMAEIHVLVDESDGRVDRLYWIQFEGKSPQVSSRYDYSALPFRDTIGDYAFYTDVRHGAYTEDEIADERDTGTVGAILAENGYAFPAPMMRARMVTLDDERRNELLVIYMEALSVPGVTEADLDADPDLRERQAAALRERATAGLEVLPTG